MHAHFPSARLLYLGVRFTSAPAGATWLLPTPDRLITIRDRFKLFRGQMKSLSAPAISNVNRKRPSSISASSKLVIDGEILAFSTTDRNQLTANASLASSIISPQLLVRLRLLSRLGTGQAGFPGPRQAFLCRHVFRGFFPADGAAFLATRTASVTEEFKRACWHLSSSHCQ
jgi:hypothetical protein